MHPGTKDVLKALEQHYEELDESPDSWESAFRIFLMSYGQLMEHSMHMVPRERGEAVIQKYSEITARLNDIMLLLRDKEE